MFLSGKKVDLRGFEKSDIGPYKQWLHDSEVTFFLEMGDRPQRDKEVDDLWQTVSQDDNSVLFAMVEKNEGKLIGICGLVQISAIHRRAQLNILIGEKDFWGKGCGKDACSLLVGYSFNKLNLNSVQLGVNSANTRAVRAYESIGFVFEGKRCAFIYRNGKYYDTSLYSILRSEYVNSLD